MKSIERALFETGADTSPFLNLESTGFLGYTGMQHRMFLPENDGILCSFAVAADYGFWMRNVAIPLDIIFLGVDDEVVHIHANAQPGDMAPIYSGKKVSKVLEANTGWCARNNVTLGVKVLFKVF